MGTLRLTGTVSAPSVLTAWRNLCANNEDVLSPGDLNLDLEHVTWVRPAGSVFLATLMRLAHLLDYPVSVVPPRERDPLVYLDRIAFGDVAERCGADVSTFPAVQRHPTGNRFTEIMTFDAAGAFDALDVVAETVRTCSASWANAEVCKRIYNAVFELGYNVEQHAGETAGVVAAQHFGGQQPMVEFAVGDFGYGIPHTLREADTTVVDGVSAVVAACETFASRTGETGRGKGLKWIQEYATANTGGALWVMSGDAAVQYLGNKGRVRAVSLSVEVPGTFVFGQFPTG